MDYFTETEQSNIINDMKTHIETAKTNKLVFYNKSLRLFITPEELESAQKEGKYMQPADDWLLFHAIDRYRELKETAFDALKRADDFFEKMLKAGYI